jgi:serine/threonine protein kinase
LVKNIVNETNHLNIEVNQNENESENSNIDSSQRTLFSEYEAIDIGLKIIDLLQMLHDKDIIHTNLAPENIFVNTSTEESRDPISGSKKGR